MNILGHISIIRGFSVVACLTAAFAPTLAHGQTRAVETATGPALMTRTNELVKQNALPIIRAQAERFRLKIDPENWIFASMNDIYVLNVGMSGFERLTTQDLVRGTIIGMICVSAPGEDLAGPLTRDFYAVKAVSTTRAQLLDDSGRVVLDDLKMTVSRGSRDPLAGRSVDLTIRRRHFQASYSGPRLSVDVCIGRAC